MADNEVHQAQRVRCPNCDAIYQKPDGPLNAYLCARCGYSPLVPVTPNNENRQAALAVAGAIAGMALAGAPGAVVGGFIGYLTGSGE